MVDEVVLAVPVGTRVVLRVEAPVGGGRSYPVGATGVVARVDEAAYRVRMPDGGEVGLRRDEFSVLARFQDGGLRDDDLGRRGEELRRYVIYRSVIGSRAYGLEVEGSDSDVRGIYLPPARMQWSLYGVPEQIEFEATQEVYWELEKFLVLALKANPSVLESLYTPLVEMAMPLAEELLLMREAFLSRLVYQTYNGYVLSQFKKLEQDLRARGAIKWKHAMHLIRLLLAGITVLREGYVPVRVAERREELLAIRRGEVPWAEVDRWRLALHQEFDAEFRATRLPERPDYAKADTFLLRARESRVPGR